MSKCTEREEFSWAVFRLGMDIIDSQVGGPFPANDCVSDKWQSDD